MKKQLVNDIYSLIKKVTTKYTSNAIDSVLGKVVIDIPTEKYRGQYHLYTNAAMVFSGYLKIPMDTIVSEFIDEFSKITIIKKLDFIKPGFINIQLQDQYFYTLIDDILTNGDKNLVHRIGNNEKINIEFVSANPTGPLHIGHTRGAIIGDAVSAIAEKLGFDVTREYFINDAGTQVNHLTKSLFFRYKELVTKEIIPIPKDCYPGQYLIATAEKLFKQHGDQLLIENDENYTIIQQFAINEMLVLIKNTLHKMNIYHDVFTSENQLRIDGTLSLAEETLQKSDMLYRGILDRPKYIDEKEPWESSELLLIRTKQFGDDSDRPLKKRDGSWAYIAGDVAYCKNKFDRGFRNMVLILGSDHKGYTKRLTSIGKAITNNTATVNIKLYELVNFVKNKEVVKMSKRSDNFLTVDDVLEEISPDILRFIILANKAETMMNFDFNLAKQQSKDNPIFYVQYAHSRCCSVLKNFQLNQSDDLINHKIDYQKVNLTNEHYKMFMLFDMYENAIIKSWQNIDPFYLVDYLINLASEYHHLWNLGNSDENFKLLNKNNDQTIFNMKIVCCIKYLIGAGLETLKIKPIDRM